MKFLPNNMEGKKLMPIHVYYSRGDFKENGDDILDFVYKDMETGKKYVETIVNPYYEVWIVKPEHRNFSHIKNFIKKEYCTCHKVHYKTRYREIGQLLGISDTRQVKICPYVFQMDIAIEHFYLMQFKYEYGNNDFKQVDVGFLDIESDIFQSSGKIVIGEAPISMISYMDAKTTTMHSMIVRQDHVPHVAPLHPKYKVYEGIRESYYKQVDDFVKNIGNFTKKLHDMFDELYGKINYHITMFDNELDMLMYTANLIRECSPDYWFVWNLPYDEDSMITRVEKLGGRPNHIFSDPDMIGGCRDFYFKGDNNPKPQKRRHISNIFTRSIPIDQIPLYAGIRVSKGALQSMKLNKIAQMELKDEKYDYSEYGDFKYFMYNNFEMFALYNIKDVLLQYGIEMKNHDAVFMADTVANDCVLNNQIFTTTITETMALRNFAFYDCGQVMGNNKNKMELPDPTFSVSSFFDGADEEYDADDFIYGDEEESDDEDGEDDKKKKYSGAYVMSPAHINSSGSIIMGKENKYFHRHVIDEDIGSEYPTGLSITNCTNDTLVGKVFLLNPDDVKLPFCDNFRIIDAKDEEVYSKIRSNAWMMELWSERDPLAFGELVLGLPSPTDVLIEIGEHLDDFK